MLLLGLLKVGVLRWQPGWGRVWLRTLFANALLLTYLLSLSADTEAWLSAGLWQRVEWLALLVIGGGLIYLAAQWLAGLRLRHLRA